MTYRDILVLSEPDEASSRRIALAAKLAAAHGAELTGLFLKTPFRSPYFAEGLYGGVPPVVLPELVRGYTQDMAAAAAKARAIFEAATSGSAAPALWDSLDVRDSESVAACVRRVDLTVAPAVARPDLAQHGMDSATLILASGGPVLIVPDNAKVKSVGERVLIAWNGSREAARAVRDAMPIIEKAHAVFVLTVQPHPAADRWLERRLALHGVKAGILSEKGEDADAVKAIRAHIQSARADLLVMGLFGHSRTRELVMGGVSRNLLHDTPIPILASH